MYEQYFRLTGQPFPSVPMSERYFPTHTAEQARQNAIRCIEQAQGPALVVGSAGSGKSLLCQTIASHFHTQYRIAMLNSARLCTRRALLQNILFELKLPYRGLEEGELRLSLVDHLEPSGHCPHGMLLIVDEADVLPIRLLEEIRMLTNLVRENRPRVRLMLAANPSFEERLANPKLNSFNQRIASRSYLQSLNREETKNFVRHQLITCGANPHGIFTEDALEAIATATDGVPRLINQLCDHAMMLACLAKESPMDAQGIQEAWSDLQQLPAPWWGHESSERSVLEFGSLSDSEGSITVGEPVTPADSDSPGSSTPVESSHLLEESMERASEAVEELMDTSLEDELDDEPITIRVNQFSERDHEFSNDSPFANHDLNADDSEDDSPEWDALDTIADLIVDDFDDELATYRDTETPGTFTAGESSKETSEAELETVEPPRDAFLKDGQDPETVGGFQPQFGDGDSSIRPNESWRGIRHVDRNQPNTETNELDAHEVHREATAQHKEAADSRGTDSSSTAAPDVELVFHRGHDPFGGPFDEEEVVEDVYDASSITVTPQLATEELFDACTSETTFAEGLNFPPEDFDPASDPVMPNNAQEPSSHGGNSDIRDDRDLIFVEDTEALEPSGSRRSDSLDENHRYRQLFAAISQPAPDNTTGPLHQG